MKIEIIEQLQAAGAYLFDNALTWGSSGNISARTSAGSFLITASGTHLGELMDTDFLECNLDGVLVRGIGKPSIEVPFHRAVYQDRPDVNAVLHASPFYSTLIACSDVDIPNDLFAEAVYYLERVVRVDFLYPGSTELAESVRKGVAHANVLILNNHGVLVVDESIKEAVAALHTLEVVCRMLVLSRSAGISLVSLPGNTLTDLLDKAVYRPRRKWAD